MDRRQGQGQDIGRNKDRRKGDRYLSGGGKGGQDDTAGDTGTWTTTRIRTRTGSGTETETETGERETVSFRRRQRETG